MSHDDVTIFLLGLAVLLGAARLMGEIARRLNQPAVVGEIIAGVLLGPTVLGMVWPAGQATMFPQDGPVAVAMSGLTILSICLFLLVAGMEIDLSSVLRRGKSVALVALAGIVAPMLLGGIPAWIAPQWFGAGEVSPLLFAAFVGTAMAITALPVIAKILMDLKLFQTDMAVTIIAAAILNDLAGWMIFAFILSLIGIGAVGFSPLVTIAMTLGFVGFMLTIGRAWINRSLPWILAHSQWPSGVLVYASVLALFAAACTEFIGVHAIFGAFLLGVALGDSPHLRRQTRSTIEQFVTSIFAPIFFAGIGLKANFAEHFDVVLVLVVLGIATLGKVGACWIAARLSGFERRDAWAVGVGMNARGAMEIVLGLLALEAGLIHERLFVALVVMAVVTSATSGMVMQRIYGRKRAAAFHKFVSTRSFVADLPRGDPAGAIAQLAQTVASEAGIDPAGVVEKLTRHGRASAMGNGIALPHTRVAGLSRPVVGVGLSRHGLDFDAADGQPVWVIVAVLSPEDEPAMHLGVLSSVAEAFSSPQAAARLAASVSTLTELRAFLNIATSEEAGDG